MSLASVLGVSVVLAIIAYFIFKLRDTNDALPGDRANHFILQLLLIFFLFSGLFVLSSMVVDEAQDCTWQLNNTMEVYMYGNNFTGYHWDYDTGTAPDGPQVDAYLFHKNVTNDYDYYCIDSPPKSITFFKLISWLIRLVALYIFLYFIYEVLRYFGFIVEKEL